MCIRATVLAHIALLSAYHERMHAQEPAGGSWTGAVLAGADQWRISMHWIRDRRQPETPSESSYAEVDFPDVEGYGKRFSLRTAGPAFHLERPQLGGGPIVLDGRLEGDGAIGTFTGLGVTAPFVMKRSRDSFPSIRLEPINFRGRTVSLAGSLYLPQGPGPFPAVVEIHGSGPDSRAKYETKAVFLARHGVAALIYDKRGTGSSTGNWQTASMQDLALDALAGVNAMRSRPEIDSRRIGVEGFSQGGWIAPLAASMSTDVAFVIAGSPSGIDPMAQSIFQVRNEMRQAGDADSVINLAVALRERLYASPRAAARRQLSAELTILRSQPWFARSALPDSLSDAVRPGVEEFLHFDPESTWVRVHVPVLAYWGENDIHLPAGRSRGIIAAALAAAHNRDTTFVTYPGADHDMSRASASKSSSAVARLPRSYPTFEMIAAWIVARFQPSTPAARPSPTVLVGRYQLDSRARMSGLRGATGHGLFIAHVRSNVAQRVTCALYNPIT